MNLSPVAMLRLSKALNLSTGDAMTHLKIIIIRLWRPMVLDNLTKLISGISTVVTALLPMHLALSLIYVMQAKHQNNFKHQVMRWWLTMVIT